jgi:hypothetical protein
MPALFYVRTQIRGGVWKLVNIGVGWELTQRSRL